MSELPVKSPSQSKTIMHELVMPNDTNPLGNLMGGYLMRWMDIAASITAGKHCEAHVVTVSVDSISFHEPILMGEVITLEASITKAFNTSVEVFIKVSTRDIKGHSFRECNTAYFTFVAIHSGTMKPIPVPKIHPETDEEKRFYEEADQRRELRLLLSGRIKPSEASIVQKMFFKS